MRTRTIAAIALTLTVAGCAPKAGDPQVASARSGAATASANAAPSADPDAALKFSRCMREHGITDFPDPVDGKLSYGARKGTDMTKVDAAQEACKKLLPNGGQPPRMSAEELDKARALARCMRENGVPKFPDPDPDGGLAIDASKLGTGPGDPTFDRAEKTCARYAPEGARREQHSTDDKGPAVLGRAG